MSKHTHNETGQTLPEAIVDQAIDWSIRLNNPDHSDLQATTFAQWLDSDPRHAAAWQRIHFIRDNYSGLPSGLAHRTLSNAQAQRQHKSRRQVLKLLGMTGVIAGSGWLGASYTPWQRLMADITTAVGELRTVQLADGSEITLNTDTAIRYELTPSRRQITLLRGEIRIESGDDVAFTPRRPLWTATPQGQILAIGTRFNVRLEGDKTRVSVQEGQVALHGNATDAVAIIRAGESRWLTPHHSETPPPRAFAEDAWTTGVISGENIPLGELLDELARYRPGVLRYDPALAHWPVSGVFQLSGTGQTLDFLTQVQPIAVHYRTRWWTTVVPLDDN